MRSAALAALAIAASACATPQSEHHVRLGDGGELVLVLPGVPERVEGEQRVAFVLESGVVVTVQDLPVWSEEERLDRTDASIADALTQRFALGERRGGLGARACSVGQLRGQCVEGWIVHEGRRFERSGMVLVAGEQVVWLDAAAASVSGDEVRAQGRTLLAGATLRPRDVAGREGLQ